MNILLLILLTIAEVVLAVKTLRFHDTKKEYKRSRLIINAAEFVIFLVMVLFPGISFGFRFAALIALLIVRLLISAVILLPGFIKDRKEKSSFEHEKKDAVSRKEKKSVSVNKETECAKKMIKKPFPVIASTTGSVILFVLFLIPSFLILDYHGIPASGSYEVKSAEAILIDSSRVESFETDGSFREVPICVYYPESDEKQTFPIVVFSHGAFGISASNYSTYVELASNGYVVVALDHPYHAFYCKDTNGATITVNPEFISQVMYINSEEADEKEKVELASKWLEIRIADVSFVLDTLIESCNTNSLNDSWFIDGNKDAIITALSLADTNRIGVMGHSLGGACAEAIGRIRTDVDAVIDLDGTMLYSQLDVYECETFECAGETYHERYIVNETPYPIPILSVDNDEHYKARAIAKKDGMVYVNNVVLDNAIDGYETYYVNAGHMNYTDLPLITPFFAGLLGTGPVDAKECITTINGIVLDFFDAKLKDKGEFNVAESYGDSN